jgi:hypothetical protein
MGHQNRTANKHQHKAREFLAQAQAATDLDIRQRLVKLCERELAAAVSARQGKPSAVSPKPDSRKWRRRSSDEKKETPDPG